MPNTFYVEPSPRRGEIDYGVIRYIIAQHQRLLPKYGWKEVDTEHDAQLVVGHLGSNSERLDVFHLHGLYPTGMLDMPKQCWAANAIVVENVRRASNIIAVSDWVAETLRRDMHLRPLVQGHGIDLDVWKRVPITDKYKKPYVLWNKTRTLGVCDPGPMAELAKRLEQLTFVTTFVPDGFESRKNVAITGVLPKEEMWPLVKSANVYLATTKETFGIGTLEAMACGVPVVGYNWGAVPDVLGDAGLIVDPFDLDALEAAVLEAMERREEFAARGLERVKRYTWDSVVRRMAKLYERCLPQEREGPKVTVVVPCYNYADYVGDAIGSVLAQTLEDFELIVVDDGSTDASSAAIKEAIAGDSRASLLRQKNAGVAHARNNGIGAGTGEYVSCLDADDMMAPTFLERMVSALDSDACLGLAYSALRIMHSDGTLSEKEVHGFPSQYKPERGMKGNQIPTCNMFRRDMWERLGGYRQRFAPHGAGIEDADFWVRILANGASARMVVDDSLFYYRVHGQSATRTHKEDWKRDTFYDWCPWDEKGGHPLASQLGVPPEGSWAIRDYDRPRVAIVVPVGPYHTAAFVDALDSVVAQTYRHWELIVVNDTGAPLDTTAWPYAKVYETEKPSSGPGRARNIGTEHATAPLVVYLDADDVLQPGFLEHTLRAWLEIGGWIYTDFYYIGEEGVHRVYQAKDWESSKLWDKGIASVTGLYPVEAWRAIGGFDEESPHEDWVFHIELTLAGWCGTRIAEPLITYRHETGKRREEGIAGKAFIPIKKRYSRESLMGCNCGKGGGRKKAVVIQRAAQPIVQEALHLTTSDIRALSNPPDSEGFTLVRYVGKSETDIVFRGGRSRMQYIFSSKRRLCWVRNEDATRLTQRAVLNAIDVEKLKQAMEPNLTVPRTVMGGIHASVNA